MNSGTALARVAIDLGAESCRVSLLRWAGNTPSIEIIHRIANGPVRRGNSLHWPLESILAGLDQGLRRAAAAAPEGIASIAVDGWSADCVRLAPGGQPLIEPFCYRDERTVASMEIANARIAPFDLYQRTGAIPLRINTVYQLIADGEAGRDASIDTRTPWVMVPEYVLFWLSGKRVAEYSNATHTGLVNLETRGWDAEVFRLLDLDRDAAPPIVSAGTVLGPLQGPLAELEVLRDAEIIAPACHDTASAIAGVAAQVTSTAYLCTGTWSLVGTVAAQPVTSREAFDARYTNLGSASGGVCFHTVVNGMWLIRQCMEAWSAAGRAWTIEELIRKAAACDAPAGIIAVDAEPLMLEGDMPACINRELERAGCVPIEDAPGNEPQFARVIFESLATRYAAALVDLERMLDRKLERIHMLGGANRNRLLVQLTGQRTGLPVEIGATESSTIGNFAVQLAASEAAGGPEQPAAVRAWAARLCCKAQPA